MKLALIAMLPLMVILYVPTKDGIDVVRVLHSARNIGAVFGDGWGALGFLKVRSLELPY